MIKPTLHVICVAFHRPTPLKILIGSFIVQTNPDWILHIVHDGAAPQQIYEAINSYSDPRIQFECTPQVNGHWGHPNRGAMLRKLTLNHRDYVLITNDDNYYVPIFVEEFFKECRKPCTGFVYCDTLHSYQKYDVLKTELKENHIDMGSFIVRLDVARKVGFKHRHFSADGTYAIECVAYCIKRQFFVRYIPKCFFIHN